jgi:hypothetical protein
MKPATVSAGQAREGRVVRYYLLIRSIVKKAFKSLHPGRERVSTFH